MKLRDAELLRLHAETGDETAFSELVARHLDLIYSAALRQVGGEERFDALRDRLIFAVTVHSIECWLLPLLFDNNKAEKTTGCLSAANHELRRQNHPGLSSGEEKFPPAYQRVARDFRKRTNVDAAREHSASLDAFVADLERKCKPAAIPAPQA